VEKNGEIVGEGKITHERDRRNTYTMRKSYRSTESYMSDVRVVKLHDKVERYNDISPILGSLKCNADLCSTIHVPIHLCLPLRNRVVYFGIAVKCPFLSYRASARSQYTTPNTDIRH